VHRALVCRFGTSAAARTQPTLSLYCQGLNQSSSGTAKNAALINLHLATGQIGKPGAGPFSLTGQPNAMGGREVGGLANLLSAHRDLANPAHRAEVAALWGVPSVPDKPGKTAVEMFQAAATAKSRRCGSPAPTRPRACPTRPPCAARCSAPSSWWCRKPLPPPPPAPYADLLLPATTWGEKDGTVTNSERRISRVRAAAPPGRAEARHDWADRGGFAQRLERLLSAALRLSKQPTPDTLSPTPSTPQRRSHLERAPRIHPRPRPGHHRPELRHAGRQGAAAMALREGDTGRVPPVRRRRVPHRRRPRPLCRTCLPARGRAARRALPVFSLTTGRLRDQWHGMSRTGTLGRLFGHVAEPAVQMHPQDMARRLPEGRRPGARHQPARLHRAARAGQREVALSQAFIAMHWGPEYLSGAAAPASAGRRQCADHPGVLPGVQAARAQARGGQGPEGRAALVAAGVAWLPEDEALAAREALKPLMAAVQLCQLCALFQPRAVTRTRRAVLFRAAASYAPDPTPCSAASKRCSAWPVPRPCATPTKKKGQRRAMKLVRTGSDRPIWRLCAGWRHQRRGLDQDTAAGQNCRRRPMAGCCWCPAPKHRWVADAAKQRGRQVCTCFNVTDIAISGHLATAVGSDDAAGRPAGQPEMRHQLRQLRPGTQAHGARHSPYSLSPSSAMVIRHIAEVIGHLNRHGPHGNQPVHQGNRPRQGRRARRSRATRPPTCSARCSTAR
jgi:assimilatory nitrate reductase catalytic subunit